MATNEEGNRAIASPWIAQMRASMRAAQEQRKVVVAVEDTKPTVDDSFVRDAATTNTNPTGDPNANRAPSTVTLPGVGTMRVSTLVLLGIVGIAIWGA